MPWNLDSDRPIYLQLMERIQHDIISGTYKPGDKLPSVRELAMEASVNPNTTHPVIHLMPDQEGIDDIGGTLRLGSYPCVLDKTSKAYELYGEELIHERHRHRYEVNNDYRKVLTENGMMLSGISPDGRIVEMIELKNHPWFIATQAHPELKSRPNRPHPLFRGFITAALEYQNKNH